MLSRCDPGWEFSVPGGTSTGDTSAFSCQDSLAYDFCLRNTYLPVVSVPSPGHQCTSRCPVPLGCKPTLAAWLCSKQHSAGEIPHRSGLLGEITHLPLQEGEDLLCMCIYKKRSFLPWLLGVVKISDWHGRDGLKLLPCRRTWQQLRDSLSWPSSACSGSAHPSQAGAPTYRWPYSGLIQGRKPAENLILLFGLKSVLPVGFLPQKLTAGWDERGQAEEESRSRWLGSRGETARAMIQILLAAVPCCRHSLRALVACL